MDGRTHADAVTDSALDRELRRALDVEPSPEFVARVRMRVAKETMSSPGWALRWQYVAAACAVAATAAIVMMAGTQRPAAPATIASRSVTRPPASAPAVIAQSAPSYVVSGFSRTTPAPDVVHPEVIVSVDEQRALRRFIIAARQNRVPAMPSAADSNESSLEVPAIEIAPIKFDPLPQIAELEGERQ